MFHVEPFYDPATFTLTYVVYDPDSKDAIVIDSVLDYEPMSSTVSTASVEQVAAFLEKNGLTLHWSLETHAHADHLTAAPWLKKRLGGRMAIGEGIREVQKVFKTVFDMPPTFRTDGSQFDALLEDGQVLEAGTLRIETIATPGHTPGCVSYHIGDAVFTGDALFIEDYGTGRCDFPKGSADALYTSIHDKLYALPDETRVFVGHDYQPGGRPMRVETTIGRSKRENVQLRAETTRADFVAMRNARDATLAAPRLLWQSVQVNIDAGRLPAEHGNGVRYLRIPLNLRKPVDDDGTRRDARAS
ncbi:MBL fold metallo-hydrolase [Polyangium sp. y55x31]|uniref:MBL fold metallo-hydrolase n=1 Tax=Polyangium sp. y55x31 TaxID=3042688 RepID=UPI002482C948|nr:MBL fold metallo-hydrolase [Polyangium sp. y55x31]MDI1475948.1 MBL fold metallo-hydrolase [Polyangium sp. y55x31]